MKKVIVGLDAGPSAVKVLEYAVRLVERTGGRLVLVRAVGVPVEFPAEALALNPAQLTPMLLDQAQRALEKFAEGAPPGLVDHSEVELGKPWQVLCTLAEKLKADLIVIGAHGYGPLDRLLGTTAARVVNHAHCPVLVVRDPDAHPLVE